MNEFNYFITFLQIEELGFKELTLLSIGNQKSKHFKIHDKFKLLVNK